MTILTMSFLPFLKVLIKLLSMEESNFEDIKNILICVPKMNEGLTGLERHEGE